MQRPDIKDLSKKELEALLAEMGEAPYRARQIYGRLYGSGAVSFDEMTDLAKELRRRLNEDLRLSSFEALDIKRSSLDGTTKYLFKLYDDNTIESVFLPETRRRTACLSSQVGCKFGCTFCASTARGFVRNLSVSEILNQIVFLNKGLKPQGVTHLVFMGIGEPFDNYENVLKAIRVFNDKDAFNIGARRITISTCGVIPGIEKLMREKVQVELSVSLHSANDAMRSRLVPINKKYPLKALLKACAAYIEDTGRLVTFEYVLIKGVNSSPGDATGLAKLLKGMKCKVNVISYNRIPSNEYERPLEKEARAFCATLKKNKINALARKPKGDDIAAGCGQLRISRL